MSQPAITYESLLKGVETAIENAETERRRGVHDDFSADRAIGAGLAVLELWRSLASTIVAECPSMRERFDVDTDRLSDRVIPFLRRKTTMHNVNLADALRLAINVLRDSAEARKMPSGVDLDGASAALHADAAEVLSESLEQLHDHE